MILLDAYEILRTLKNFWIEFSSLLNGIVKLGWQLLFIIDLPDIPGSSPEGGRGAGGGRRGEGGGGRGGGRAITWIHR